MRARRLTLAVLATAAGSAVLSACSMIPTYERPVAPVPAAFPQAGSTTATQAAADIDWRAYFGDARLKALIELALANNRDLRVAIASIEQARAQYGVRRADELPSVGAGISASRTPTANGGVRSYSAGVQVTAFELDFFGRVRSLSQVALEQFLATEQARKTVQISLVAGVANAYLALRADDELLALTQRTVSTREESLRLTKLRFDNGAASELDYRQAESLLEGARATLAQLQRQRAQDENALTLLVGTPLPAGLPAPLPLDSSQLLAELPAGVPSEVLTRRPDVLQAEQTLRAANANIGAARAAFFPRISLTGSAGVASSHLSDLFGGGNFAWTFAPQLLQPIFDAGRNQSNLDSARAGRDIAVAQYERAIQSAFREVADALAGRATLGEQLRAQRAQANAEQVRFNLADLRYRNGAASYLDVLDAQRALFTAQQAAVQVQAAQVQNLVTLYKALGGGWKEPVAN